MVFSQTCDGRRRPKREKRRTTRVDVEDIDEVSRDSIEVISKYSHSRSYFTN